MEGMYAMRHTVYDVQASTTLPELWYLHMFQLWLLHSLAKGDDSGDLQHQKRKDCQGLFEL
jgi:hypothetical protein